MTTTTTAAPARRTITVPVRLDAETRQGGGLRLSGLAIPYEAMSEDIGFFEVIERGAFRSSLEDAGSDVLLLWMHDGKQPLARQSAGNLEVRETPEGVRFAADLPNTTLAHDAVELARTGVVRQMSFGFVVQSDSYEQRDGQTVRVVKRARLHEVSLVGEPAYSQTSAEARNRELAERIERTVAGMRRPKGTPDPYRPAGKESYSFFRDLLTLALEQQRERASLEARMGIPGLGAQQAALPAPFHGSVEDARARLNQLGVHLREQRDLTTTVTAGGYFVPQGAPVHIGEAFAAAVRARGVLPTVLPVHPLPPTGMEITTPRITIGTGTGVQAAEHDGPTETSLVEEQIASDVSTIAGMQDVSQQLLDRSEPGIDVVLAADLGRALAEDLDVLLLTGSGTAPELRGLDNVSGGTSTTYTDASATASELLVKIAECASRVATALGIDPDIVVWHPRREAWAVSNFGSTFPLLASSLPYNLRLVTCPAVATTNGASTNEDVIYVLRADELPIYLGPVNFRVHPDQAGSGTLTVRITSYMYASALFGRRPEAIGTVSGTGLAAWY